MEHAEANCREVVERLYLYLDGEIAGADCSAIERHLAACEPCLEHVDFERAIKALVRLKCRESDVPSGLIERLQQFFHDAQ